MKLIQKMKKVFIKTFDGMEILKSKARKIGESFYIPNRSCFKIGNRWYPINSPSIALNVETNQYDLKSNLQGAVIDFDKDMYPIFGYISKRVFADEYIQFYGKIKKKKGDDKTDSIAQVCLASMDLVKKYNLYLDRANLVYMFEKCSTAKSNKKYNYRFLQGERIRNYTWDGSKITRRVIERYEEANFPIQPGYYKLAKVLGNLSFGLEFETIYGTIPSWELFDLGLIPVRDGSISGYEYTTIPLKGAKGLQTIENICLALNKYCEFDFSCSLHIHFGNTFKDKIFITAFYAAACQLQQEVFDLVPFFKRNQREFLGSSKEYCKMLPLLNIGNYSKEDITDIENFKGKVLTDMNILYKFLSGGYDLGRYNNRDHHPEDIDDRRKWQREARYHWVNLIPLVFKKDGTIEFRIHHSTYNPELIINWLFICASIIKYVEKHPHDILSKSSLITLEDTINVFAAGNAKKSGFRTDLVNTLLKHKDFTIEKFRQYFLDKKFVPHSEINADCEPIKYPILKLENFYKELGPVNSENSSPAFNIKPSRRNLSSNTSHYGGLDNYKSLDLKKVEWGSDTFREPTTFEQWLTLKEENETINRHPESANGSAVFGQAEIVKSITKALGNDIFFEAVANFRNSKIQNEFFPHTVSAAIKGILLEHQEGSPARLGFLAKLIIVELINPTQSQAVMNQLIDIALNEPEFQDTFNGVIKQLEELYKENVSKKQSPEGSLLREEYSDRSEESTTIAKDPYPDF